MNAEALVYNPVEKVTELQLPQALDIGRKLTRYFVYCCGEGEHYVALVERLREANTRSTILEAIYRLIHYGEVCLKYRIDDIDLGNIRGLFRFIKTGAKEDVSQFHSSLSTYIWNFEVEKIREQERYLLELLGSSHF